MKIQIRKGVFETNSSSVHTIAVPKNTEKFSVEGRRLYVPSGGEFGWGFDTLDTPVEKAAYLWQAIRCSVTYKDAGIDSLYDEDCNIIYENALKFGEIVKEKIEKFKSLLDAEGVQYELECPFFVVTPKKQFDELQAEHVHCEVWAYCPIDDWSKVNRYTYDGFIDHGNSPEIRDFVDYILSDSKILVSFLFGDGYVQTGNDNDDEYYEHFGPEKLSSNCYEYFVKGN